MSRRQKRRNRLAEAYLEHPKSFVFVWVLFVVLTIATSWVVVNHPEVSPVRCGEGTLTAGYHRDYALFVQVGERHGSLNISFIRIPENMGIGANKDAAQSCFWPIHTRSADMPGERGPYYTRIHVQSVHDHAYTLGDTFEVWGRWFGYPGPVYFASDGVSFYRTQDFEILVHRGPVIDPRNDTYSYTQRVYGTYVPQAGDYVEMIVHEPYTKVSVPYA